MELPSGVTFYPSVVLLRKAVRIITFSQYGDHTSPLLRDLNTMKFIDVVCY